LRRQEVLQVDSGRITSGRSRARVRRVTQVALASLLCFVSFGVGRLMEFRLRVPPSAAESLTLASPLIVQESVEASAESAFRSLVFNNGPTETIWGPAEKLPGRLAVTSKVP
jgi:hypothetical protein